jgi:hypothetical protein
MVCPGHADIPAAPIDAPGAPGLNTELLALLDFVTELCRLLFTLLDVGACWDGALRETGCADGWPAVGGCFPAAPEVVPDTGGFALNCCFEPLFEPLAVFAGAFEPAAPAGPASDCFEACVCFDVFWLFFALC